MASSSRLYSTESALGWLYPMHAPDWFPPYRAFTDTERRTFLEIVHEYESVLGAIQELLEDEHLAPTEDDYYGNLMFWRRFYGRNVRVLKIMETPYEFDQRSDEDPRTGAEFRHILYSVIDSQNPDDKLMWITLRRVGREVSLITASERPYFLFRALVSGVWQESYGMHVFLGTTNANTRRGDLVWFRRHMSRYSNELVHALTDVMANWIDYIRERLQPPVPAPPPLPIPPILLTDPKRRLPPSAAKNT
jgi:hypothetical protein